MHTFAPKPDVQREAAAAHQGGDPSSRQSKRNIWKSTAALKEPERVPVHPIPVVGRRGNSLERQAEEAARMVLQGGMAFPGWARLVRPSVTSGVAPSPDPDPNLDGRAALSVLVQPGGSLPESTRRFFESCFGRDLGAVRIHTGGEAGRAAATVDAPAFSAGSHIVFSPGVFAPDTARGRHILAHELAHVLQHSGSTVPGLIQRFDETEHRAIGDVASGGMTLDVAPGVHATYGEMVSLAGDYFADWPTLIRLAHIDGITEGTRGEVLYALLVKVRANAIGRSEKAVEAEGMGKLFDEKAKAAVMNRYRQQAFRNIPHFPNPRKGDETRSAEAKDSGSGAEGAGATYRKAHAQALMIAAAIGREHHHALRPGAPSTARVLNDALVLEAFAGHFLTDSFSSGHQQTARASIQEYWDAKIPDFFDRFQKWLADAVTLYSRAHANSFKARVGAGLTPQFVSNEFAMPRVKSALAKLPRIGFGDIVSGAVHDYFNKHGSQAEIGGKRIELVGDKNLLPKVPGAVPAHPGGAPLRHVSEQSRATFNAAVSAVQAGIEEVKHAYELGREGETDPGFVADEILKEGKGTYAAEKLIPSVVADSHVSDPHQRSMQWEYNAYEQLLADPRMAEGFTIALDHYADLVGDALSGLSAEDMEAVKEVLIKRMKGGPREIGALLHEIMTHTPVQGGGFDPSMLQELRDMKEQLGPRG